MSVCTIYVVINSIYNFVKVFKNINFLDLFILAKIGSIEFHNSSGHSEANVHVIALK